MDIQKIFDKVSNREIAFTYLIKKVAETPLKSDRMKITNSLIDFLQKEQDELKAITIYDIGCTKCGGNIDPEDGSCCNCG
jgi:hypothetical protein